MKLVVVLPALNEEMTIASVVGRIPRDVPGVREVEAVVVDDGSTDGTARAARAAGARVVSHGRNRGNGAAVISGLDAALRLGADLIVTIDADGQFDPGHIPDLLRPLLEGRAKFVSCTRFARPDLVPKMPRVKVWGNRGVTAMANFIARARLTDASCGFRAYTRDAALKMNTFSAFDYAQEGLITLALRGVPMAELSLPVRGEREFGDSRIAHNLWGFGTKCLSTLLRTMRDFRPLLFFGSIGATFFAVGFGLGAFVLGHWAMTGETKPYTSFLTGSAVGLLMGVLLIVLALVADLLGRSRNILEEILSLCKAAHYQAFLARDEAPTVVERAPAFAPAASPRVAAAEGLVAERAS